MSDLLSLVRNWQEDGTFVTLANNAAAQFGPSDDPYLGATLLPERPVDQNAFREDAVRMRTVMASHSTRYSPAVKKSGGFFVASFLAELGDSDIAVEMSSRDYEAITTLLGRNAPMDAAALAIRWFDVSVTRALRDLNELERWQAIVNAQVIRQGANNYREVVNYLNPSGHRVAAGGTWSSDAYDPWDDIVAGAEMLRSKGYRVNRIISSSRVTGILAKNDKVAGRAGRIKVVGSANYISRVTTAQINAALAEDELPPIEVYNRRWRTQTATGRMLADTVMVMVATTGRDETVDLGDNYQLIPDTLGYYAIGKAAGQSDPGRATLVEAKRDKPPRIEAQGWQTSFPIVTEPEAIFVITGIG